MFLITRPHLPRDTATRFLRGWPWLVVAGLIQPLVMEAYNVVYWYWADPGLVRLATLTGPMVVMAALTVALQGKTRLIYPAFVLWVMPWGGSVIGIEENWAYRSAFLGLQLLMVAMWLEALFFERTTLVLVLWAKRVGLAFASLGVVVCVLVQFVLAETPFLGRTAAYDPVADTASAEVQAGMAATVWLMPLASVAVILALAGFDLARRSRRRLRLTSNRCEFINDG